MKLFFILVLSLVILESCGRKSDPKYQSEIKHKIQIIS
jgi:hypothetical protein